MFRRESDITEPPWNIWHYHTSYRQSASTDICAKSTNEDLIIVPAVCFLKKKNMAYYRTRRTKRCFAQALSIFLMPGFKGQNIVLACKIRHLNLGPAKHEEVAIYAVNMRIPNV